MRIIVDVMGGDYAPEETVKGLILAEKELHAEYTVVGDREKILKIAKENHFDASGWTIVHTDEVMTMEDDPLSITRAKKNTSMAIGLKLLADGEGDAFVSTGNTGALFAGATLIVRKIKGISRPGIASIVPFRTPVLLLDSGANITVNEENLLQFAVMGTAYMKKIYGLSDVRVGLINNGGEACKGTQLYRDANRLLSQTPGIRFVGNVEGTTIPFDACDVIVADGFTGNILLKSIEGCGKFFLGRMKKVLMKSILTKLSAAILKPGLSGMKKDLDPTEFGGSPILGVRKTVIKAHGSSKAKAFKNAIRQAIFCAESGVIEELTSVMEAETERKKSSDLPEENP